MHLFQNILVDVKLLFSEMGYLKFFKLIFQYLVADLRTICDSPQGKNSIIKNRPTFRLQQDMAGGSKLMTVRTNRSRVLSSRDKRSLCTISRPNRYFHRKSSTLHQRSTNSFFDTSANESDKQIALVDQQNYETIEPVAHRTRARKYSIQNYKQYLTQVIRKVNESTDQPITLSSNAMECMSNFMVDVLNRMALESCQQVKRRKTKILGDWDINSAFKIVLPHELGVRALALAYAKSDRIISAKSVLVAFNPENPNAYV